MLAQQFNHSISIIYGAEVVGGGSHKGGAKHNTQVLQGHLGEERKRKVKGGGGGGGVREMMRSGVKGRRRERGKEGEQRGGEREAVSDITVAKFNSMVGFVACSTVLQM